MPGKQAMIIGHSLYASLRSDLIASADPRMTSSFNLIGKMDQILFLGNLNTNQLDIW